MAKKSTNNDTTYVLNSKVALPNKLLQDDGTVTDITGRTVINATEAYDNKPALPNKFLNPDGTYSTLNEIIASMVDTSIYVIVDELPAEGDPQKVYLISDGKGGFVEYHWTGTKWDPIGMIEFDLSNYSTTQEMMNAIEASALLTLNSAKNYTDTAIENIDIEPDFYFLNKSPGSTAIATSGECFDFWRSLYDPTNNKPFIVTYQWKVGTDITNYTWYFQNHNFTNNTTYTAYSDRTGEVIRQSNNTQIGIGEATIKLTIENNEVVQIEQHAGTSYLYFLETGVNYSRVYTPESNGSPATKKYVDDSIVNNITNVLGGEY